ncbi:hypothetical protein N8K70_14720 [Microbacterium betulae]|uniref:Uncharacterized protein n=1 Tax=Microbacterium betulae TaxID=2981139 RepID=A0AA97FIF6_9MICO|nr:hypothetical protein [Microbacterium sp. AB]WOF22629.1 hypothetical protein N8K70_14720 [Microbacterium sp. AB]
MALDTMLAAEIEQLLKSSDEVTRAELVDDLVGVVFNYVTYDGVGGESAEDHETSEQRSLGAVAEAARSHLAAARSGFGD